MKLLLLVFATLLSSALAQRAPLAYPYAGRNNLLWVPTKAIAAPTSAHAHTTTPAPHRTFPLFVMLHGCNETASDFALTTKMNTYCDQYDCFVLYPEQPVESNPQQCWNWFKGNCQVRGGTGEPAIIVQMAQSLFGQYSIDQTRVFVAGMSAGGAMAAVLGATYPDFFRAIGVASGIEYHAASSLAASVPVALYGGPDPVIQGRFAYSASLGNNKEISVFVIHGTADNVNAPINGQQVTTQFVTLLDLVLGNGAATGKLPSTPTHVTQYPATRSTLAYNVSEYSEKTLGTTLITYVTVGGMKHAWSGGNPTGKFSDSRGPDASLMMINLFYNYTM